jgi:hypothetical protein
MSDDKFRPLGPVRVQKVKRVHKNPRSPVNPIKQASPKAAWSPRSSSVCNTKVKVPKAMIVSTVNPLHTQSSFRLNGISCGKSCFHPSRDGTLTGAP